MAGVWGVGWPKGGGRANFGRGPLVKPFRCPILAGIWAAVSSAFTNP